MRQNLGGYVVINDDNFEKLWSQMPSSSNEYSVAPSRFDFETEARQSW